jgi:hypothetical protein
LVAEPLMDTERHLDVNKAVQTFLSRFESLSSLPFISDSEMEQLFGEEVCSGLMALDSFNRQKQICRDCANKCCRLVDCELYLENLTRCPVHTFRPVLCRMHYCHKYTLEYPYLVKELGDIFLDSLLAAQKVHGKKAALLDSPPLNKFSPVFVAMIAARIKELSGNEPDESQLADSIHSEIANYRNNLAS